MKAIFVNLQQQLGPSPDEVIGAFVGDYPPAQVDEMLWKVFRLAVLGGLESETGGITIEEVALLFDQLISLVTALDALGRGGRATLMINREDRHD